MKTIKQILEIYKPENFIKAKKIKFGGIGKNPVYNITAPFKFKESLYIFGREEDSNKGEFNSKISLFKKTKTNSWILDTKFEKLNLEDPFVNKIDDEFIVGGVEVQKNIRKRMINYRTIFYRGKDIFSLKKFVAGPWGMKDIRLVKIDKNKIGVFTRPQGKKGGRGKIGFTIISNLQELTPKTMSNAPIINGQFAKGEWGGVNQVLILKNKKLGILGHIARYSKDKRNRFYYAIVFGFDTEKRIASNLRIILRRAELPEGESKDPGLYNVIFPGGIIRKKNGTALLYAGIGDMESYKILIRDPFKYYEENF